MGSADAFERSDGDATAKHSSILDQLADRFVACPEPGIARFETAVAPAPTGRRAHAQHRPDESEEQADKHDRTQGEHPKSQGVMQKGQ